MAKTVVKIYGDGEFWIDNRRKGKIYSDGEIYVEGSKVGKVYSDGEIYIDNTRVGKVYPDGDVYIGDQKVASGVYLQQNAGGFGGFGNVNLEDFDSVGEVGVGGGALFVIVLLIVASLYATFAIWTSELPQIIFSNMNMLGESAVWAVYLGMIATAWRHCSICTQAGEVKFGKGLVMQAGDFFAFVIACISLDRILTAISYGIGPGETLMAILTSLSGSVLGSLLIGVFVGFAPTVISSAISWICIKKGKIVSMPRGIDLQMPSAKAPQKPKAGSGSSAKSGSAPRSAPKQRFEIPSWYWQSFGVKAVCVCFLLVLVLMTAGLPASLYIGVDFAGMTLLDWAMPVVGIVAGVLIRRNMWRSRRKFYKEWLIQSGAQMAACVVNWVRNYGLDSVIYAPDTLLEVAGLMLFVGALITLFTKPFVES